MPPASFSHRSDPQRTPEGTLPGFHSLRPCWTTLLSILREGFTVVPNARASEVLLFNNGYFVAC
jgi:hypothetical protein